MRTADEALSREVERGMTREDILRRAAALGIVVAGGTFGSLTEGAFASTLIKRGGTFRQATSGGSIGLHRRPAHRREVRHRTARRDLRGSRSLRREGKDPAPPGRGAEGREGEPVPDPRQEGDRVPQRQDADDRRRHLFDQAYEEPEAEAVRQRGVRCDRPQQHQEARQVDVPSHPVAPRRDADGGVRPVLPGRRPEGLPADRRGQGAAAVHRDGPVQGQELHSRTGERAREERELLDLRAAVLQRGADHQLPVRRSEGERAPVRPGRRHGRRAVRPGARRPRDEDPQDLHRPDRCLDASLHAGRRRALQRRPGAPCVPPADQPATGRAAGSLRLRSRRQRHLLDRSIPRTRATSSRSASTTPSRRSRC